ncbi:MAG: GNAT family N-acetyltransferase [Steroidobacteraceae bacterium]
MPEAREIPSIDALPAADWNALDGTQCPFLRHEFLAALEHCGCVGPGSGWTPAHLALFDGGQLIAAAPAYRKSHSWGEFVFDFSWAQAHERNGLRYYPKLVCAVPFSPINSARLLLDPSRPPGPLREQLIEAMGARCAQQDLSSAHALFISEAERATFAECSWLLRSAVQFHWHNADYADFDTYLGTFRAEKRKQIRRERRRCTEDGVQFITVHGSELSTEQLHFVHDVHARTFRLHGHEPYLNLAFFTEIARSLGDALMVKIALRGTQPVAAAVFFVSSEALFGRYWGATGDFHSLHFEACYHQGIEYCIEHGLKRFEPGTQGEHKVVRGFVPSQTWSAHYISDPRFREAIAGFLVREQSAVEAYADDIAAHTPFRRT